VSDGGSAPSDTHLHFPMRMSRPEAECTPRLGPPQKRGQRDGSWSRLEQDDLRFPASGQDAPSHNALRFI
jgi:hypothetical protein